MAKQRKRGQPGLLSPAGAAPNARAKQRREPSAAEDAAARMRGRGLNAKADTTFRANRGGPAPRRFEKG